LQKARVFANYITVRFDQKFLQMLKWRDIISEADSLTESGSKPLMR